MHKKENTNILIADDSESIRDYVSDVITTELGYDVNQVVDGRQALDYCHKNTPDLVLLDLVMPNIGGFEVARNLKAKGIPFVVMTSQKGKSTIDKLIELGSFSFLSKPVNENQLIGTVLSALSHVKHIHALEKHAHNNCDICTARGAVSAFLSIHPDQAFNVINEIGRDQHGNTEESAKIVNQFLHFMAKANEKSSVQKDRKKSRNRAKH